MNLEKGLSTRTTPFGKGVQLKPAFFYNYYKSEAPF
jgi:hypothetical protein